MTYEVAIIGAGLSGLGLALALHQQGIRSTVYESRSAPMNIGGAVMLSPNGLKVLDALGLYQNIKKKGYNFDLLDFRSVDGHLLETYEFGGTKKYGYQGNRIYRFELIDAIIAKARMAGIQLIFNRKFSHVIAETDQDVTWQLTDGSQASASILVGADGIHSTVRKYLYPELRPQFTGMVGITSAVPASQVTSSWGTITKPITIMSSDKGAFVVAPQKVDGSELLIGKQKRMPEQTREGWEKVHADKDAAIAFLQEDAEAFGDIAISATRQIPTERVNIWPFYIIPKLDRWTSAKRRVVILGDSAHAIPPSAGQGINQAFEDIYMFALLLGAANQESKVDMQHALSFWQQHRQSRVDKVLELNKQIDLRRMPQSGGGLAGAGVEAVDRAPLRKQEFDLRWLYESDVEREVEEWVKAQVGGL